MKNFTNKAENTKRLLKVYNNKELHERLKVKRKSSDFVELNNTWNALNRAEQIIY